MGKERLTVTVDSELVEAANQAVADGRVASLSGWVNLALAERAAKERRLRTLAQAVADRTTIAAVVWAFAFRCAKTSEGGRAQSGYSLLHFFGSAYTWYSLAPGAGIGGSLARHGCVR